MTTRPAPRDSSELQPRTGRLETNRRNAIHGAAALFAGSLVALDQAPSLASNQPDRSKRAITSVTSYLLRHRLTRPFGVSVSLPLSRTRQTLLVKIETNDGHIGWGETAPISGARGTIDDHLAPRLLGRNPLEYRQLHRNLWGPNFGNGLAVGALETALNDIRGKVLNLTAGELFGGPLRQQVPVYASAMNYVEGLRPEEQFPEEAARLVEQGFKALKMRIGRYPVKREAEVARRVREAVGPEIRLMADGNGAYTMKTALQMGEQLQRLDFDFFEEPLPQAPKYAGYSELREKLQLPLAGGEVIDSRAAAKQLVDTRAFDVIQPDVSLCGGLAEALFISELSALARIRCVPHCWGGDIVIAASTHLLSLLPDPHWGPAQDTPMLELDQSENPWRNGLATKPIQFGDGLVQVPTAPGLGIEIDEKVVEKYTVKRVVTN